MGGGIFVCPDPWQVFCGVNTSSNGQGSSGPPPEEGTRPRSAAVLGPSLCLLRARARGSFCEMDVRPRERRHVKYEILERGFLSNNNEVREREKSSHGSAPSSWDFLVVWGTSDDRSAFAGPAAGARRCHEPRAWTLHLGSLYPYRGLCTSCCHLRGPGPTQASPRPRSTPVPAVTGSPPLPEPSCWGHRHRDNRWHSRGQGTRPGSPPPQRPPAAWNC